MSTLLEIPRLPFVSKEKEHASQGKIDLASVDGRNCGRLAPLTTTFTLMRSSDTSKVLHELNCSSSWIRPACRLCSTTIEVYLPVGELFAANFSDGTHDVFVATLSLTKYLLGP